MFDHYLLKEKENSILVILGKSFRISGFLYELVLDIENRSTVTFPFLRFQINNMYTFLHKKKNNFLLNSFFKNCKMYTFDQYFWLEITNSFTTKQSIIFWISTFCVNCVCNDILLMNTTYRPSMFSVLLQLKQYETRQNCWPRWMCSTSFFEKTSTATHCFY